MKPAKFSLWRFRSSLFARAISLVLTVLFVISPIGTAFAQTDTVPSVATSDTANATPDNMPTDPASKPSPPASDFSIPGVSPDSTPTDNPPADTSETPQTSPAPNTSVNTTNQTPADDNAAPATTDTPDAAATKSTNQKPSTLSTLTVTSPEDVPTWYRQLPAQPNNISGALNYSYPISVPPGRNNLTPDLQLEYDNQDSNDLSILGYDWSINIPFIERENKRGSERIFSDNYFYSSLSGELSTTSATSTYVAKVDNGDFLKYTFTGSQWIVVDKKGNRFTFGSSTSERQDDPVEAVAELWERPLVTSMKIN